MIKNQYTQTFQTHSIYYSVAKTLWLPSTDTIHPNICCFGQWRHFARATCNIQSLFLSVCVLTASFLLSQIPFMASIYVSHHLMMRMIQLSSEGHPSPQSHPTLILKAVRVQHLLPLVGLAYETFTREKQGASSNIYDERSSHYLRSDFSFTPEITPWAGFTHITIMDYCKTAPS